MALLIKLSCSGITVVNCLGLLYALIVWAAGHAMIRSSDLLLLAARTNMSCDDHDGAVKSSSNSVETALAPFFIQIPVQYLLFPDHAITILVMMFFSCLSPSKETSTWSCYSMHPSIHRSFARVPSVSHHKNWMIIIIMMITAMLIMVITMMIVIGSSLSFWNFMAFFSRAKEPRLSTLVKNFP